MVGVTLFEVLAHRAQIRFELRVRVRAERLELAREHEPPVRVSVVERLYPEAVARAEQRSPRPVPERESPHAVEELDTPLAPLLVRAKDHLGVGRAAEAVPVPFKLAAQLAVVVDLAVVNELERPVLRPKRLPPRVAQVDDRESPEAER